MFFYPLMIISTYGSIGSLNPISLSMKGNLLINVTAESSFKNEIILNNKIKLYDAASKQINFYNLYSYSPINLTCYSLLCNPLSL